MPFQSITRSRAIKKLAIVFLIFFPLAVTGAMQNYRLTWDALPADQTVVGECRLNGSPYAVIGQAPGNGVIDFSLDVNPGDTINCRALARKDGFNDSAYSEVAVRIVPLAVPRGVQVAPR